MRYGNFEYCIYSSKLQWIISSSIHERIINVQYDIVRLVEMIIIDNDNHFHELYNIILYIDDPFMDAWTYDPLQLTWIDAIFKITISHWSPLGDKKWHDLIWEAVGTPVVKVNQWKSKLSKKIGFFSILNPKNSRFLVPTWFFLVKHKTQKWIFCCFPKK